MRNESKELERDIQKLEDDHKLYKRDRDARVKVELLFGFYNALGHSWDARLSETFGWLREQKLLLQEVLEEGEEVVEDTLALINPGSLIQEGSFATNQYTLKDARGVMGAEALYGVLNLFKGYDDSVAIQDAASELRLQLAGKYPSLQKLADLGGGGARCSDWW